MGQFLLRYVRFVAIGTVVIFLLSIVVRVADFFIYGMRPRVGMWENAWGLLIGSAFIAAILGVSRSIIPYLRDPSQGSKKR